MVYTRHLKCRPEYPDEGSTPSRPTKSNRMSVVFNSIKSTYNDHALWMFTVEKRFGGNANTRRNATASQESGDFRFVP